MASFIENKIREGLEFVFPGECYEDMFLKLDVFHAKCFPIAMSRFLGLAITAGSLMLFVPQILKIQAARSGKGISLSSQLLGLLACFGVTAYSYASNFVFSQWGDSLFVAIQMVIIIMQILYFSSRSAMAFAFLAFCWTASLAVFYGYVPFSVLTSLQAATIPITIVSKFLQIYANYNAGSTGQLSLISVALQFGGCLARIFTSIKETGDMLVIVSYVVATLMNGVIFLQFFIYWNAEKAKKKQA